MSGGESHIYMGRVWNIKHKDGLEYQFDVNKIIDAASRIEKPHVIKMPWFIDARTAAEVNILGIEACLDLVIDGEESLPAIVAKLAEHDIHCPLDDNYTILAADETEAALVRLNFPDAKVEVRS